MIWCSILGVVPFTLVLPYVGLYATIALSVVIGLIISSAFSAIVVYAQELIPGRVGMVSGLFFGVAFGMAGLGAAALGELIDLTSIDFVYRSLLVPAADRRTDRISSRDRARAVSRLAAASRDEGCRRFSSTMCDAQRADAADLDFEHIAGLHP